MSDNRYGFTFGRMTIVLLVVTVVIGGGLAFVNSRGNGGGFNFYELNEYIKYGDGSPELSREEARNFASRAGLDTSKVLEDFDDDGEISYGNYPLQNLRKALDTYKAR